MRWPATTPEQQAARRERLEQWHPAFAWLPVRCDTEWVWLENVERRAHWLPPGGDCPYWMAEYEHRRLKGDRP